MRRLRLSNELLEWRGTVLGRRLGRIRPRVNRLYFRGKWRDDWWERVVAVVGSRRMSAYGRRVVERIVPELVEAGVVEV